MIDDIERNDRVFTDGVGTISLGLLRRIWREFRKTKKSRATIVQILYQGELSGGDLDGDTYNVIFDPTLWPTHRYAPADYPRVAAVDIGRTVEIADMTNFFLDFMRTDRLGYISNLHLQAADQLDDGINNAACIKLAEMASTAVDFSKTGVPVSQKCCC